MKKLETDGSVDRRAARILQGWRLLAIAGVLLLAGIGAALAYFLYQPTTWTIAVGPAGGDNLRLVQALAQHLARERASIRLRIIVSADGPSESAAAVDRGTADLAVVRGDLGIPKNGQAVAILRHNLVVLIVPAAATASKDGKKAGRAKIEKVAQLAGRRVGIVTRTDANVEILNVVLRQYEIPADKVQIVTLLPQEVAAAIRDGKVDAILVAASLTGRVIADVVAAASNGKEVPTFLAIDQADALEKRFPAFESVEIPAGTFGAAPPKPAESIETIGFMHYIVAHRNLSEDKVADFARLLFGARQALTADLPALDKFETPSTDKDAAVPAHPGAAAYIDGDQKTFFDRYNDMLYWGIILVSFCGSAAAGLAGYLRTNTRAARVKLIERLIELMHTARAAESQQALDELQSEADQIVTTTIRDVQSHAVEERALAAFTLALDQARLAIADRRSMLGNEHARA